MTSDSEQQWVVAVMRDDGTTLSFYGPGTSLVASLDGYVYSGGPWWSSSDPGKVYNGRDWGRGEEAACLKLAYDVAIPSLAGSLTLRNGFKAQIAGGAVPGSSYRFDQPVTLAALAGAWTLPDASVLTIDPDGTVHGTYRGCTYVGNMAPAASGTGSLGVAIAFDAACTARDEWARSLQGFAIPYLSSDGATRLLLIAETNNGVDFDTLVTIAQKRP